MLGVLARDEQLEFHAEREVEREGFVDDADGHGGDTMTCSS